MITTLDKPIKKLAYLIVQIKDFDSDCVDENKTDLHYFGSNKHEYELEISYT